MFSSCEIGLGSAVDTEPPSVSLTQPTADSIVREAFVLTGAWSDDLSIGSVSIQFRDVNDASIIYGPFEATTENGEEETSGTWTCSINPSEYGIPDGTYVATATAYDEAEHSSETSTTFSIDNTPPLIVLESPSTTSISKPNSYGQIFTVTGKAADDSDVDSIDFIFYDKDGNEIHRKNISGVGTQLEVTVAQWGDDVYNKIYGNNKEAGTKEYYVGLVAYDGARKIPAVEGDKGNASTSFYLWDSLEAKIGTVKTSIGYKVMNGRSAATPDEYARWTSALNELKIERATFSLNPVNNPYFEVSRFEGFTAGRGNLDANEFTNKNTMVLNLYRGRDNKAVKVDTIGVYLKECDKAGNLIPNGNLITLLPAYTDRDGNVTSLISKEDHDNAITTVDSSYTMSFAVNNEVYTGIEFNKYYLVDVVGYDINNVNVYNPLSYGLKMVTTANQPVISMITPPSGGNIPKSASFKVSGYAKTTEDSVSIAVYNEEALGTPFASSTGVGSAVTIGAYNEQEGGFPFNFIIDTSSKTASGTNLPRIIIEVTSSSGLVSNLEVKIDPILPAIGECSITPIINDTYVNGEITIKQAVSDNQMLRKAEYSLDDGNTWTSGSTSMLTIPVDTTQYTDKAKKIIKIRLEDTAGNTSEGNIALNIDQSTDKPVPFLSNVDDGIKTLQAIKDTTPKMNIFGTQSNNTINGSISDDDGIDYYKIIFDGNPYGGAKYGDTTNIPGNGKTSVTLSCKVPEVEGTYDLYVYVKDSKQDNTGNNTYEPKDVDGNSIKFATIAIDEGAPNFVITTTSGSLQAAEQACPVAGSWSDGTDIVIERCTSTDAGKTLTVEVSSETEGSSITINSNGTWSDTLPAETVGTDGCVRYYVATDKYGQKTQQPFVAKVDAKAPSFKVTNVNGTAVSLNKDSDNHSAFAKTSGIFTVKGTVAEPDPDRIVNENEGSGLEDFVYYYITATPNEVSTANGAYVIDGNGKTWGKAGITKTTRETGNSENGEWTANIDISSGYDEGKDYILYIAAKDKARNISKIADNPSAKVILKPDATPPVFTDKDDTKDGIQALEISNKNIIKTTNEDITFTVTVKDEKTISGNAVQGSGVDTVKLYRNGVDTGLKATKSEDTYTFKILSTELDTKLSAGTNVFTVRATDKVGNYDDCAAEEVNVDRTPPKVSISGVVPTVTKAGKTCVNGKVTVSGVATDETGLKEVRYFFGTVVSPYTAVTGQVVDASTDGTYKPYDIVVDTRNLHDKTTTTMTVVSVDKAGNISDIATRDLYVDQSTDLPVITPKSPLNDTAYAVTDIASGHNLFTTTGSISADISDDDGIKTIEVYVGDSKVDAATIDLSVAPPASYSASWTLSDLGVSTVGDYTIKIKVIDGELNVSNETHVINIGIDDGAPTLELTTDADEEKKKDGIYYVNKDFKIDATVKDDYKLGTLTWNENNGSENHITVNTDSAQQTKTVNYTVKSTSSNTETNTTVSKKSVYTFTATDKFGQAEKKTLTYIYDLEKPAFTNVTYSKSAATDGAYYYDSGKSFTIKGMAKETGDKAFQSGLNSVEFIVYSGHHATYDEAKAAVTAKTAKVVKDWQSTTGTSSWTAKLDSDSIKTEGEYTVFIRATDFAGNETIYATPIKVVADAAKPEIAITSVNSVDATAVDSYYTDSFVIGGTVTDTYLRSFDVSVIKGADITTVKPTKLTGKTLITDTTGNETSVQPWSITVPKTDGEYEISIVAKDEINTTTYQAIKFAIDTSAPTFEITKVKNETVSIKKDSPEITRFGNTSDYFTIKGTVADAMKNSYASGVASNMYYIVKKTTDSLTYAIDNTWSSVPVKTDGTWEAPVLFSNFADGNACYVYFAVQDKAGNTSLESENPVNKIIVKIDQSAPTVSALTPEITDATTVFTVTATDGANGSGIKATSALLKLDGVEYKDTEGHTITPSFTAGANAAADSTYKFTIDNTKANLNSGANSFTVTVTDEAGNPKTTSAVIINNDAPTITVVQDNASENSKAIDGANEYVYQNVSFDINGTIGISTNNKIKSVSWVDKDKDGNILGSGTLTAAAGPVTTTVDPTATDFASYEGKLVTRAFTVTNVYGQLKSASVNFVIDKTPPVAQSDFKVGGKSETELSATDTWLKASALKVSGSYVENVSGINSVTVTLNDVENPVSVNSSNSSGTITYKFDSTISGFTEGDANVIKFDTVDKAKNTASIVTISGIKIDTTAPELTKTKNPTDGSGNENSLWYRKADEKDWNEFKTSILTNKSKNIELQGTFSDKNGDLAVSGVSTIKIKVGTYEFDAKTVPTAGIGSDNFAGAATGKWQATLDFEKVNLATGSHTMSFEITDVAGNITKTNNGTIVVDADKPEAKINPITDADTDTDGTQVNKTISLVGTASDNNALKEVTAIQISSDYNAASPDSATWTELSKANAGENYTLAGTTNWTAANFDTTKFTDGTYYLRAKVLDEAGNTGYSAILEIMINQDSDRPVIKIPTLNETNAFIQSETLMGTISDDDGITSFEYSEDGTTWTNIPVSSGSWKVTFAAGTHNMYFKVVDASTTAGTFITKIAGDDDDSLKRPFLTLGSTKTDNDTAISLSVDLKAPEFKTIKFNKSGTTPADGETVPSVPEDPDANSTWEAVSGKITYSPSEPYMYVKVVLEEDVLMHESDGDSVSSDITISLGSNLGIVTGGTFTRNKDTTKTPNEYTYLIGPIDLSTNIEAGDGTKTVTITAKDKSGRSTSSTFNVSTDKTAPTVSLNYPTADDKISGKVTLLGSFSDSTGISLTAGDIQYLIPTKDQQADSADLSDADWKNITVAGNLFASMKLAFESSSYTQPSAESGKDSLIYYATNKNYATPDSNGIVTLPIYFKTKDTVGNIAVDKSNSIVLAPDAGIPTVELSSHTDKAKTAGVVNLMGSASDDEKVESVKITKLEYTTKETIDDDTSWTTVTDTTIAGLVVTDKGTAEENGVIKCVGTTSWKASIDTSKLGSTITAIRVTVESFDENGTPSSKIHIDGKTKDTSVTRILVDKSVPKLESASIVGFAYPPANAITTPSFEKTYSSGMYISKNNATKLYFKAVISDDSSVTGIDFTCNEGTAVSTIGKLEYGLDTKEYTVLLPIDMTTEGHIYATLEMLDGQHTDVTQNFSFYIDNTAPKMYSKSGDTYVSNDKINNTATLRLENNSGLVVNTENVVENSDGSYTFGDSVEEAGSGLAYVVYWFGKAKSSGETNRVYNPMFNNGYNNNKTNIDGTTVKLNSENLPVFVKTVTRSSATTVEYDGLSDNKNIRVGGLVKLGGSYHLIKEISENVVTLADSIDTSYKDAEFVYAQVVDHAVTEGFDSTAETGVSVSNDDGDGMVEMVKQTGTTYKWSSSILSDKIEDGPAEIHVTVFDAAGNVNSGYVKTSIQNNRPRISRVFLGTDLNGNGKFDYYSPNATGAVLSTDKRDATANGTEFGELSFYSALSTDGKLQGNVTIDSSSFVVSGDFLVLPEIVGGNGTLKYNYMVADTEAAATSTTVGTGTAALKDLSTTATDLQLQKRSDSKQDVSGTGGLLGTSNIFDGYNYSKTATKYDETNHNGTKSGSLKGLVIKKDDLKAHESWTTEDGKKNKFFAFTFWDETGVSDGLTQGKDTLNAVLKVPVVVNVDDDVKPTANIKPFYWNSKEDSSFVYDENGNPQGHIDIDDGTGTTNPGVAGRVYVEGTAKDETRLGALYFTEPDEDETEYQIAEYKDGVWVTNPANFTVPATWANIKNVWVETISEPSQAGHEVAWKVEIDMTPNGIATGKTVNITAKDAASKANTSDGSTAQTIDPEKNERGALTSHYIMDFVPYIKSIYPANGTANRSRLGKYSVRAGEDMIIEGMNFAKDASYTVVFKKTGATTGDNGGHTTTPTNWSGTIAEDGKITVTAPLNSRWVEVVVSGVATKNNTNTNGGYNIEAGFVAKDADFGAASANNNGTNFWTDDRYVSVWAGDAVGGSDKPMAGMIKKINNTSIWRRVSDGYECKPQTVKADNVLATWGATDKLTMYGQVVGNDSSTLGRTMGVTEASFYEAPPVLDVCIINGEPFYVALDNQCNGDSANNWGAGLFYGREGWVFSKNSNGFNGASSQHKNFIEYQGSKNGENSSNGFDGKKNQFINPHITGYKDENDIFHIWICYYDSYARCLKYAAYTEKLVLAPAGISCGNSLYENFTTNLTVRMRTTDDMDGGLAVVAGYDTLRQNENNFRVEAGEYNDILMDGTTPVLIYYNKTSKSLEIARPKVDVPSTGNVHTAEGYPATDLTESASGWSKTKNIKPKGIGDFGRYVSATIDGDGNLHVAAQDVTNGKLYYGVLNLSGNTYTIDSNGWQIVDSTSSVGMWTDIELDTDNKPVISYLDKSQLNTVNAVKVAYKEENSWECITNAAKYESKDDKTSVVPGAYETTSSTSGAKAAVGFNSTMFAVDFLRDEQ